MKITLTLGDRTVFETEVAGEPKSLPVIEQVRCPDPASSALAGEFWNLVLRSREADRETAPPVLCYVDECWAYFTTRKLSEQWGDDWDDAPYEHNAGTPYAYGEYDRKHGRKPWEIVKVAWEGPFELPHHGLANSSWSVQRMNEGCVPWLSPGRWELEHAPVKAIAAGVTLDAFCAMIRAGGGTVYLPAAAGSSIYLPVDTAKK